MIYVWIFTQKGSDWVMYTSIINLYEDRKKKLSSVLSNRKDLKPENQHQIYGAINEIELFVKTLRDYQNKYSSLVNNASNGVQSSLEAPNVLSTLPSPNEKFIEHPKSNLFSKIFGK